MCTTMLNGVFQSSNDCSQNEYTVYVTNGLMIVVIVMQFNVHVTLTLSLLWGVLLLFYREVCIWFALGTLNVNRTHN